jgi:hypothetical protein
MTMFVTAIVSRQREWQTLMLAVTFVKVMRMWAAVHIILETALLELGLPLMLIVTVAIHTDVNNNT